MAEGTVKTIEIDAPAEVIFDVAADVARFPEWATGVRETEVLEANEDGYPIRAHLLVDGIIRTISYFQASTRQSDPMKSVCTVESSYIRARGGLPSFKHTISA